MKPIHVSDIESMQAALERLKAFLGLLAETLGADGNEKALLETAFCMADDLHKQATEAVNAAFE